MKTNTIPSLLAAGALAAICALPLSARDKGHSDEFAAMDADADGRVSRSEHLSFSRSIFQKSDANSDRHVTAAEWDAAASAVTTEKMDPQETAAQLKIMDTDGDGTVSEAESDAFATSIFSQADKDSDGFLSGSEYRSAQKDLKKAKKQKS